MDCTMVSSRMAAFLDGELNPSDVSRFEMHIQGCNECMQIVVKMEEQRFRPLSSQERGAICGRESFWGDMDSVLGTHLDQMVLNKTACLGPWHTRRIGLPIPMLVAYAAAMVLAVAWGAQQRDRAMTAEMASEHLGQQLEAERRLAAQPAEAGTASTYKVVTYTPERGTF